MCAWAESTSCAVLVQWARLMGVAIMASKFVTFLDHAKWFEAHSSQFFTDFRLWYYDNNDNNNRQTDRLLCPCACAWGKTFCRTTLCTYEYIFTLKFYRFVKIVIAYQSPIIPVLAGKSIFSPKFAAVNFFAMYCWFTKFWGTNLPLDLIIWAILSTL